MIFYEKIGLVDLMKIIFAGEKIFYLQQSLFVLLFTRLLGLFPVIARSLACLVQMDWGDTVLVKDACRDASKMPLPLPLGWRKRKK